MKMEKTLMEFVAFDAQDVIATSDPGPDYTGKKIRAKMKVLDAFNDVNITPKFMYTGDQWVITDDPGDKNAKRYNADEYLYFTAGNLKSVSDVQSYDISFDNITDLANLTAWVNANKAGQ